MRTLLPGSIAIVLLAGACAPKSPTTALPDVAQALSEPPAVAGCHAAGPLAPPADLPANLRAPGDTALLLRLRAEGKQIYLCQKNPAGSWAFTLKAPDARLISDGCTEVGHHFGGPSWSLATDGSVVVGKKLAEAPRAGTIPWLLIAGTPGPASPGGTLAAVRFIQRVDTAGGVAPVEGCGEASAGQEVAVPYTATYLMYGSPSGAPASRDHYRRSTPRLAAVSNSPS